MGKPKTDLIGAVDKFAEGLLEQARVSESLADKISAFEKIGKWVAIRNKLEDTDDAEGSTLNGLRAQVRGAAVHLTPEHQRAAALARWHKSDASLTSSNGGPALDAIHPWLWTTAGRPEPNTQPAVV